MILHDVVVLSLAANENCATSGAHREDASFAPADRTTKPHAARVGEDMALAMLRSGRSFTEAAESSGVSVKRVMALWAEQRTGQL